MRISQTESHFLPNETHAVNERIDVTQTSRQVNIFIALHEFFLVIFVARYSIICWINKLIGSQQHSDTAGTGKTANTTTNYRAKCITFCSI